MSYINYLYGRGGWGDIGSVGMRGFVGISFIELGR